MKHFLSLTLFLLIATSIIQSQTIISDGLDGEIYVKFKNEYPLNIPTDKNGNIGIEHIPSLKTLATKYEIKRIYKSFYFSKDINLLQTVRVEFLAIEKVTDLIKELQAMQVIEYAEPVPFLQKCLTPNDMGTNSVANGTWHLYKINAQQAWDISTGSTSVTVGIVDDAVQTTHPDLAANMLPGRDVADGDNDPNPPTTAYSHGTHVAGISAAVSNNGVGVASIGYSIKILPVKSTNSSSSISHGYEGITWAANNGADIINMSWGGEGSYQTALNVINSAYNLGCVLIAAAGNSGDDGNPIFYPAAYNNVIAVANTTSTDAKATSSQYGTWVDIAAPGTNIRSTIPNNTYAIYSGTSMASPLVSGLAGLMLSVNPNLTQSQLKSCLQSSAVNIDAQNPNYIGQLGAGRINAYQALLCVNSTVNDYDAGIASIMSPATTTCNPSITPMLKLRNYGQNTLTSATIRYKLDNGTLQTYNWTGSLATNNETNVSLPNINVTSGSHTFMAYTTNPNNNTDQNNANDTSTVNFYYFANGFPLPFNEDFESNSLNTNYWSITNPDNDITWEIVTTAGNTPGDKSAKMNFFNYTATGQRDGLQTPPLNFTGYSSIEMTFNHAYRRYDQSATDSLLVYVSIDCGTTFPHKVLEKGENGQGVFATASTSTNEFTPALNTDWCLAGTVGSACYTVDLSQFIGNSKVIIKFEGYNSYQNNLFLDNINITGVQSNTAPTPNFSATPTNICAGNSVSFTDLSTPSASSWNWTFPGGTPASSTAQNPTVVYNTAGTYNVTLEATNGAGSNSVTYTNYITVNANPLTPTITQNGNTLTTSATNVTYEWFFNGTSIPNSNTQSITASTAGTYTVKITNTAGCHATSADFSFTGSNPLDAGIISIISPSGITCSSSITPVVLLKNFGSQTLTSVAIKYRINGGTVNTYNWNGSLASNSEVNATLNPINTTTGNHTFTAYTHLPNGNTDTNNSNDTATSTFNVSSIGTALPFTEDFQSGSFSTNGWTISNPDNDKTWEIFTTNGTFTGNIAARMNLYSYPTTGQRDALISPPLNFSGFSAIQLKFDHAYRRYNTNSTDSLIIYVSTDCGLTFPTRVLVKGEAGTGTFATAVTNTNDFVPIDSTEWCMGTVGSDCFTVDLTSFAGSSNVMLKFESYNNYGNNLYIDNINITGTPSTVPPLTDFIADNTSITTGGSVNFTDLTINNPTSWNWTFSGGTPATSNVQNPTNIVYNTPGTYNVKLVVTNTFGADSLTKSAYITVNAGGTPPVADFIANTTSINAGGNVNFTDLSLNSPTSWNWTFSGGTPATSNVQNPTNIVYNTPGTYNVKLVVANAFGADSLTKTTYITVNATGSAPVADFIANSTSINAGGNVNFTDLSLNSPTSWNWTFSGGTPATSNVQNPTNIVYNTPGTYNVKLVVTNAFGADSLTKTTYITVNATGSAPVADFIANNTNIYEGSSVNFTDLSLNSPSSWSWTFSGGSPSSSSFQNPVAIVYNNPGTYNVKLVVTNTYGTDSITKTAYITVSAVTGAPVVDFSADTTTISEGDFVNFTDLSTNTPTTWLWAFEGGSPSSSSIQNPTNIQYNNQGTYYVTLIATNSYGSGFLNKDLYITVLPANSIDNPFSADNIRIYPNPANHFVFIEIESNNNTPCMLKVKNLIGQEVIKPIHSNLAKGKNKFNLDVSQMVNGVYFLEFESENDKITKKIIIF